MLGIVQSMGSAVTMREGFFDSCGMEGVWKHAVV